MSWVGRDIGMTQSTVNRHLGLLEVSHLIERVEAFSVNRTKRLIKSPKLHVADTGLALHLAGEPPRGAHLESLVVLDALAWADAEIGTRPSVMHWRTTAGQEVDVVIERGDALLAVEVKASTRPHPRDARHLRAFIEEYDDRVTGALLLHGGDETWRVEDRILAAPWWRVL